MEQSWCNGSVALLTASPLYLTGLLDGIRTDRFGVINVGAAFSC